MRFDQSYCIRSHLFTDVLIAALLGMFVAIHFFWLKKTVLFIKGFENKCDLLQTAAFSYVSILWGCSVAHFSITYKTVCIQNYYSLLFKTWYLILYCSQPPSQFFRALFLLQVASQHLKDTKCVTEKVLLLDNVRFLFVLRNRALFSLHVASQHLKDIKCVTEKVLLLDSLRFLFIL